MLAQAIIRGRWTHVPTNLAARRAKLHRSGEQHHARGMPMTNDNALWATACESNTGPP